MKLLCAMLVSMGWVSGVKYRFACRLFNGEKYDGLDFLTLFSRNEAH